jgi:vacuolar iron transporter family protein
MEREIGEGLMVSEFKKLSNYVFGSAAAIITNVSLIVGLGSAQAGKGPIIGALLTIAIADNISDSLGIHLYKESEGYEGTMSLLATAVSFTARLVVSLSFIAVVLALPISTAIPVATAWGLLLLTILSYLINRSRNQSSIMEIAKHLFVALIVIWLSRYAGDLIAKHF